MLMLKLGWARQWGRRGKGLHDGVNRLQLGHVTVTVTVAWNPFQEPARLMGALFYMLYRLDHGVLGVFTNRAVCGLWWKWEYACSTAL